MRIPDNLTLADLQGLLKLVEGSLGVRSHLELFNWLREGIMHFLPHEAVIAAWGDFSLGLVRYDVVSAVPGFRTDDLEDGVLQPFVTDLFVRWRNEQNAPFAVAPGVSGRQIVWSRHELLGKIGQMPYALVHGIKDQRGRHDCLYIFLGPDVLARERAGVLLRYLLPYVDTAFRQVAHLPSQYLPAAAAQASEGPTADDETPTDEFGLSAREHDIMEWVRAGKTNQEIGLILDISAFTVKNHIQRIFKKLNVVNRAQAVSKMGQTRNSRA